MIQVKRLDGQEMILNAELIFSIQKTPDTLITFTTGERLMVLEEIDDIMTKVISYRRYVNTPLPHVLEEDTTHENPPEIGAESTTKEL